MGTSAIAVKSALKTRFEALAPAALVTYGAPGNNQPDEIIAILDQRLAIERMPMSTARNREETLETQVAVSIYQGGDGPTSQQTATERAWAIHDLFDDHVRTKPNETLDGACRDAWISAAELVESRIESNEQPGLVLGRVADLTLTITTTARI